MAPPAVEDDGSMAPTAVEDDGSMAPPAVEDDDGDELEGGECADLCFHH